MSKTALYAWLGVATAGAVGVAVMTGVLDLGRSEQGSDVVVDAVQGAVSETEGVADTPEPIAAPAPVVDGAGPTSPAVPGVADGAPLLAEMRAPGFDLVRVEPDGQALIAGHAMPDSEVAILVDGVVAADTRASGDGKFVSFLDLAVQPQARILSLRQTLGDQVMLSEDEVIVTGRMPPQDIARAESNVDVADAAASKSEPETGLDQTAVAVVAQDAVGDADDEMAGAGGVNGDVAALDDTANMLEDTATALSDRDPVVTEDTAKLEEGNTAVIENAATQDVAESGLGETIAAPEDLAALAIEDRAEGGSAVDTRDTTADGVEGVSTRDPIETIEREDSISQNDDADDVAKESAALHDVTTGEADDKNQLDITATAISEGTGLATDALPVIAEDRADVEAASDGADDGVVASADEIPLARDPVIVADNAPASPPAIQEGDPVIALPSLERPEEADVLALVDPAAEDADPFDTQVVPAPLPNITQLPVSEAGPASEAEQDPTQSVDLPGAITTLVDAERAATALGAPNAVTEVPDEAALRAADTLRAPDALAQAPTGLGVPEPRDPPDAVASLGQGASDGDVNPRAAAAPEATAALDRQPEPTVLLRSARGVEVLQAAPLPAGGVALDAISYDAEGEVLLSGRGQEDAFVRIYLDNSPLITSAVDEDGRWRVTLPDVDTGTYTLRVDQVDPEGVVSARVESPFLRESAAVLAAAFSSEAVVQSVTVQPGNTLWAIAKGRYGDGLDYVKVFDANRERIRNPNLIYPGQIFDLPTD